MGHLTMAQRGTRSTSVLFNIQDTVFKERKLLDITKPIQVPSVRYVTERYFTIKKEYGVRVYGCKDFAFKEEACELQELWIFLNLQPKCHSAIEETGGECCEAKSISCEEADWCCFQESF